MDKMIIKSQMKVYPAETPKSLEINSLMVEYIKIKNFQDSRFEGKMKNLQNEPQNLKMIHRYFEAVTDGLPQQSKFVKRMKKYFQTYFKMRKQQFYHKEKKQVMNAFDRFLENEFKKLRMISDHQWSFTREMKRTVVKKRDGVEERDYHDWMYALDIKERSGEQQFEGMATFEQVRVVSEPDQTSEDLYESEEEKLAQAKRRGLATYRHRFPDGRYVMTSSYSEKDRRVTKKLKDFFGRDHPALVFEGLLECENRLAKQMRNRVFETTQKLLPGSLGKLTAEKMFYLTLGHPTETGDFQWMDGADLNDVRLQLFVGYSSPKDFFKPGEEIKFEKRENIKKLLLDNFAQKNGQDCNDYPTVQKDMLEQGLYIRYLQLQKDLFVGLYERLGFHSQSYVMDKVQGVLNSLLFSNLYLFSHLPLDSLPTAPAFGILSDKTEELLSKTDNASFDILYEVAFANEQLATMGLEDGKPISKWTDSFEIEHVAELLRLYRQKEISIEVLGQHLKAMEATVISKEESWSAQRFAELKKLFSDLMQLMSEKRLGTYLESADISNSMLSGGANLSSAVENFIEREMREVDHTASDQSAGLIDEVYNEKDLARIRTLGEEQLRLGGEPVKFSEHRDSFQEMFFNKFHDDARLLFIKQNWNMADDKNFTDYQNRAFRSMVRELGLVSDVYDSPVLDPRPFNSPTEMKAFVASLSNQASTQANSIEQDSQNSARRQLNEDEKDLKIGGRKVRSLESVSATVKAHLDGDLKFTPESEIQDVQILKDQEEFKNIYIRHAKAAQKEQKDIELSKDAEAEKIKREEENINDSFKDLEKVFKKYSKRVVRNFSDNKTDSRFPLDRMLLDLCVDEFNCLAKVRSTADLNPSNFRSVFELYLLRRHPRVKEIFEKSGMNVEVVDQIKIETDQNILVEDLLLKGVDLKLPFIEELARIYFSVSKGNILILLILLK